MTDDYETDPTNYTPPNSDHAEACVIAMCMLDTRRIDDVLMILSADDFYQATFRIVFREMVAIHNSGRMADDKITIERLKKTKSTTGKKGKTLYDDAGGDETMAKIGSAIGIAHNVEYFANVVKNASTRRAIIGIASDAIHGANQVDCDAESVMARIETSINRIRESNTRQQVQSLESLLLPICDSLASRQGNNGLEGITTGVFALDQLSHGFCKGQLIILAARPAIGKTALAMQMAASFATSGQSVLYVSLEMTAQQLSERLLLGMANVNAYIVKRGMHTDNDIRKINVAASQLAQLKIDIETTDSTVSQIAAIARRQRRSKNGLGLLIVDYLQLIRAEDRRMPREQQISEMSRRLKSLSVEMNIPILCLAQLNRQAESGNAEPQLHFLRESGAIEQDADQVWMLWKPDMQNIELAKLKVAKNRHGQAGSIDLEWIPSRVRFDDSERTRSSPEYVAKMTGGVSSFADQFD